LECPACRKNILREGICREEIDDEAGPGYVIIYPEFSNRNFNLPEGLNKAYKAAQNVKNVDPNAYAVLLGRLLDKICIDKNAIGNTLNDKIKSLAKNGVIPEQISRIALGVKDFRNIGAHADLGELSDNEISIVEELINVIIEYIYEAPSMIQKVEREISKLKRGKTTSPSLARSSLKKTPKSSI
jgi:Domain of unknown function (DUF4145)